MKKITCLLLGLLLATSTLWSQQLPDPDDLPIDDDSLSHEFELVETYGGAKSIDVQDLKLISLRSKTPPIGNIGNAPSAQSLTWAISRAMTMAFKLPASDALSPHFLFDLLTKANAKCQLVKGRYMAEVQSILKEKGNIRQRDYSPNSNCLQRPNLDKYRDKPHYYARINSIVLPSYAQSREQTLYAIKRTLKAGFPVVTIMQVDAAFRNLRSGVWIPDQQTRLFGHVVVIIGYDDERKQLEIANCWGEGWGNRGFCRIRYEDVFFMKKFFQISPLSSFSVARTKAKKTEKPTVVDANSVFVAKRQEPKPTTIKVETTVTITPSPTDVLLKGLMQLRYPVGKDQNNQFVFEDVKVTLQEGIYHAGKWEKDQQFQLMVSGLTPASYLYLISIDPHGKTQLHWPVRTKSSKTLEVQPISSRVNDTQTTFVLPKPRPVTVNGTLQWQEQAFTKTEPGTDYVVMLHASEELTDEELNGVLQSLYGNTTEQSIQKALKDTLGKDLVAAPQYNANRIQYTARSNKGYIVPVLMRVD